MHIVRLAALALMVLTTPAIAQTPSEDIVVQGAAVRQEIERILREDNLSSAGMTPREQAETMSGIARGRAPEDFWTAYQAHVQAWQRYAEAVDQAGGQQAESSFGPEGAVEAQTAIETTFAEVERIALRYGARLPAAPVDVRTIA